MPRHARLQPCELGGSWPQAPIADPGGEAARKLAINLTEVLGRQGLTNRAAAQLTGVDHTVIGKVLNGRTWADLRTIAMLEYGLDAILWPTRTPTGELEIPPTMQGGG